MEEQRFLSFKSRSLVKLCPTIRWKPQLKAMNLDI